LQRKAVKAAFFSKFFVVAVNARGLLFVAIILCGKTNIRAKGF